jgi:hypothetical protein
MVLPEAPVLTDSHPWAAPQSISDLRDLCAMLSPDYRDSRPEALTITMLNPRSLTYPSPVLF